METIRTGQVVRLKSGDTYLLAGEDQKTVTHGTDRWSNNALWTVETTPRGTFRLLSCYQNYLTASDEPFLPILPYPFFFPHRLLKPLASLLPAFMKSWKVLLSRPEPLDQTVEWGAPSSQDFYHFKLAAAASGKFLRANGGLIPWRHSVTLGTPWRTSTQGCVIWELDSIDNPVA